MKYTWIILALVISNHSAASENTVESNYIKNYIEQMTPVLIDNFSQHMPDKNNIELTLMAEDLVVKMAKCQFDSVSHYPKDYWEQAIIPISNGESIQSSNAAFEDNLGRDIEAGSISEEEMLNMVQTAIEKVNRCLEG